MLNILECSKDVYIMHNFSVTDKVRVRQTKRREVLAIGFKLVLANACGILKVKDIFDDRLVVSDANVKNNKYIRKIGCQCCVLFEMEVYKKR